MEKSGGTDILIIGNGVAGMSLAIKLARAMPGLHIDIINKSADGISNTRLAQGGMAVVLDLQNDSFDRHVADTLVAGDGLCDEQVVRQVVSLAPALLQELIDLGLQIDNGPLGPDLAREGGHSAHRVVHTKDMTGAELERVLLHELARHNGIRLRLGLMATDLLIRDGICLGAHVATTAGASIVPQRSRVTVIASGGMGQLFACTTNPLPATADGQAMALRAGLDLSDMQYVQFHPTALYLPHRQGPAFLLTEALRGAGAVLLTLDGHPLMAGIHPMADLAPRDVVARAMSRQMQRTGTDHVLLDCRQVGQRQMDEHFPNILRSCRALGLDPLTAPLPVASAAHYICGGIPVPLDGNTSITGLYAIGEVARTGLHGANRLASNSLLEALVMAHMCAQKVLSKNWGDNCQEPQLMPTAFREPHAYYIQSIRSMRKELQQTASLHLGPLRTAHGLLQMSETSAHILKNCSPMLSDGLWSVGLQELANLSLVAGAVANEALLCTESKGGHHMLKNESSDQIGSR